MGEGVGQKCMICRQGGGGRFLNCLRTHFSRRLFTEVTTYDKKCTKIHVKNRGKNREHTKIELMNLGGGSTKSVRLF